MSEEGGARVSSTERQIEMPTPNGFDEEAGCYGVQTDDGFDVWTTFQLRANSLLRLNDEKHVDLTVVPAGTEDSYDVRVPFTVFNSV